MHHAWEFLIIDKNVCSSQASGRGPRLCFSLRCCDTQHTRVTKALRAIYSPPPALFAATAAIYTPTSRIFLRSVTILRNYQNLYPVTIVPRFLLLFSLISLFPLCFFSLFFFFCRWRASFF